MLTKFVDNKRLRGEPDATKILPSRQSSGSWRRRSRPRPAPIPRATDTELNLVAYSTPREAYLKLIPMFQKTPQGADVDFKQSYGASGEQARAVRAGLNADIVALSWPRISTRSCPTSSTRSGRGSPSRAW